MNNIILIGAIGKNRELGYKNKLIWYIPEDLNFFKNNTINHTIVMGYNTFISLPKLLNDRKHIVLSRKNINLPDGVILFHDKESVLEYAKNNNEDIYIIGGASIYKQFIDYSDRLLLTEINASSIADTYFPSFDISSWDQEILCEHNYNNLNYNHVLYKRKNE